MPADFRNIDGRLIPFILYFSSGTGLEQKLYHFDPTFHRRLVKRCEPHIAGTVCIRTACQEINYIIQLTRPSSNMEKCVIHCTWLIDINNFNAEEFGMPPSTSCELRRS